MNEKGYDDSNTEFIYKNAQGDASNLNTICQQMVSDGVDLVAAIATPSAQAMVNMKSDIPVSYTHLVSFMNRYKWNKNQSLIESKTKPF